MDYFCWHKFNADIISLAYFICHNIAQGAFGKFVYISHVFLKNYSLIKVGTISLSRFCHICLKKPKHDKAGQLDFILNMCLESVIAS